MYTFIMDKIKNKNIQIAIETATRCGGNCSGCALSSSERLTKSFFDLDVIKEKIEKAKDFINKHDFNEIESISIFLGQGDHFLYSEDELEQLIVAASNLVPISLKHRSVFFLSASAIGKHQIIKQKLDHIYAVSLNHSIPFFVQVVFDPKKIEVSESFRYTYLSNISYFKELCGMTELTVNLGSDLYETMTPDSFTSFVNSMGITHVEFNWVLNENTKIMWSYSYKKMFDWLQELLSINSREHTFEVNFIPFLYRAFKYKNVSNNEVIGKINDELNLNYYIDNISTTCNGQGGLISNIIPIKERLKIKNLLIPEKEINGLNIFSKLSRHKSCSSCEYIKVCSLIGSESWLRYWGHQTCPYDLKSFLIFLESNILNNNNANTCYNTNPVQSKKLIKEFNNTHEYYESKFR